ncbi:3-oxoacyl-[acyl-carrier-protein] reductase, chloroplastic [Sesamum alatum]|uniref:3-oxoacyl-[acyl-carrier-protein] reductase, chloroplastic n=1 Tax=Sesamum alatum TaxID=300844 RepID=A0AAE1YL81_9LAMI|nr:3-oxoacyl-[acyl-carrier-protein] reductase, chloroplastic [Sesamum alatum]
MESRSQVAGELEPWLRLENKVVLVTGASSGLGREFCLDLAKAGCCIVAAARRKDRLQSLCDEINSWVDGSSSSKGPSQDQPRAVAVELDVTAAGAAIEASVQKAWVAFGRIDVLINNAGITGPARSSVKLSEEEWKRVVQTNLMGPWLVAKFVAKRMHEAGREGSIINISSTSAVNRTQFRDGIAYGSSKAGLDTMTKIMALDLGEFKIRVNSIAPGLFEFEITKDIFQKNWLKNVAERSVPLGAFVTSNPGLTSLVRYLVHDSSNYISGNIFIVDSGYSLPGVPIFSSL